MKITQHTLVTAHPVVDFTAAIVADLHDRPYTEILVHLHEIKPDVILIPGDLCESFEEKRGNPDRLGFGFLAEAARIAPTFYALGNHEIGASHRQLRHSTVPPAERGRVHPTWREAIRKTGVILLDEDFVSWHGITVGGLGSALHRPDRTPDTAWVERFAAQPGYKLLLCHHPEYYHRFLRNLHIDLVVSGHAHGGQWRIFDRGVFAPGQGIFPKYTSGLHDNKLLVSRGLANNAFVPRLFNPCELIFINFIARKNQAS
jgi:predicted MPP superfamily phosphohydrolase